MIKLKVIKQTSKNVTFIIEKQTDEIKTHSTIFKASNGWEIKSFNYPQVNYITKTFWVRGEDENLNKNKIICSINTFKEIQLAIDEYNCSLINEDVKTKKDETPNKELFYIVEVDGDIETENFDSYERAEKYAIEKVREGSKNVYIYKRIAEVVIHAVGILNL